MPGWELKTTWFQEDSLPRKGLLSLEVYSGEGMVIQDCQVNRTLRNQMMALVLAQQRNLFEEIVSDMTTTNLLVQDTASAFSAKENRLEYTPSVHLGGMAEISAKNSFRYSPSAPESSGQRFSATQTPFAQTPAGATPGLLTPLESCEASIQSTSDVMLFDRGMQLLYPQLTIFQHYETGHGHPAATHSPAKGAPKRVSTDFAHAVHAGWVQTGSNSRYMKVYRLEDLHANLKAKTSINWTYAPLSSGGTANRGASRGASRGNA